MKNTKLVKLLVMLLSLTLLIGSAIGIAVSAAEDTIDNTGAIEAKTIVHNDKIQLGFYIDATAEALTDGTFTVEYYWEGDESNVKTAAVRADGVRAGSTLVATEGVAYYELTKRVYVTVYGAEDAVIDTATYSVAQFLYAKLYRDGFAVSEDSSEIAAADCYKSLLELGTYSQIHLGETTYTMPNELPIAYTTAEGCTVDGTNTYLFAYADETLTIAPTYNAGGLGSWNILYADGDEGTLAKGASMAITKMAVIEPVFKTIPSSYDFEAEIDYGITANTSTAAFNNASVVIYPQTVVNSTATAPATYGQFLSLVEDARDASNQVLKVYTKTIGSANDYRANIFLTPSVESEGNIVVIEFDYNATQNGNQNEMIRLLAHDATGAAIVTTPCIVGCTANNSGTVSIGSKYSSANPVTFAINTWVRIRVIIDTTATSSNMNIHYSTDAGTTWKTGMADMNFACGQNVNYYALNFNIYNITCEQYLDNITCYKTTTAPTVSAE